MSKKREANDARAMFKDAKNLMATRPLALVHDGLQSYNEAITREFYTNHGPRIENVRSVGSSGEGLNQMAERVNNTIRDREKTFRGMDNDKSAQVMADGMKINYNFLRPHMGLDGKTPAQVAGLDLDLDGIRWKELIKQATLKSENKVLRDRPLSQS